jgi:hypothetical protein
VIAWRLARGSGVVIAMRHAKLTHSGQVSMGVCELDADSGFAIWAVRSGLRFQPWDLALGSGAGIWLARMTAHLHQDLNHGAHVRVLVGHSDALSVLGAVQLLGGQWARAISSGSLGRG